MSDICINQVENHWKTLTTSANELYKDKKFNIALKKYYDALYRAEVLNIHIKDCIRVKVPFMQVYVISCNNLSHTFEELGKITEAEAMLERAFYYLLQMAKNDKLNINEIKSEIKRAALILLQFTEKHQIVKVGQKEVLTNLQELFVKK